jgi:hypothetical protein
MSNLKRRQVIEKAERMSKGGDEITLSEDTYQRDLLIALNYYNSNHDDKDKKKWFITHYAKIDKKTAAEMLKVDEHHFRHAGILTRLIDLGSELQEKEQNFLNERIEFLKSQVTVRQKSQDKADKKATDAEKAAAPANVISIQQRMEDKAHEIAGEIEGAIDDFVLGGCKSDFSTKNYLLANQVAGPIAKRIGEFFVSTAKELREALEGDDPQLVEGYSHLTKRELKRFAEFVEGIIADCQQMVQTAKANRAPRKTKPVSPTKLASKMKYLKEFAELNLKSIVPSNCVGASEVWFYNTKYRRVGVYKAENGTLSVKGTTIIGFDIKESKAFTLRKPEDFFKGLSLGKRALGSAIKTLKTKPSQPNGRINEETIILGAF